VKNIRLLLLLLGVLTTSAALTTAEDNNCLTCHQDFEDEETGPSHLIVRDIHIQKGLGCADCHGGGPSLEDMDEVRESPDWRGVPSHLEVPDFCARCHGSASYMHEHNPSLPTDQPTCANCHADAEYMADYDIPTDQFEKYRQSVHGKALLERKDLGAPVCNDCHGNHGAAPPGVASLSFVCGNCHAIEAELFNASPHRTAFEENDFPMCETCHSNHLIEQPFDKMLGAEEPSTATPKMTAPGDSPRRPPCHKPSRNWPRPMMMRAPRLRMSSPRE
jgi:hypothetical protein